MRFKEQKGSFAWLPEDLSFINDGRTGKWKDRLSASLQSTIREANHEPMHRLDTCNRKMEGRDEATAYYWWIGIYRHQSDSGDQEER
jgi:hypothetical protein